MLGEFLSANVSTPFLLFMVKGTNNFIFSLISDHNGKLGFGEVTGDADIAFWTGILGEFPSKTDDSYRD
jgi:hypothetical protein